MNTRKTHGEQDVERERQRQEVGPGGPPLPLLGEEVFARGGMKA